MNTNWNYWKRRCLSFLLAYSAKYIIRILLYTCRIHVEGVDIFINSIKLGPAILTLWHDRLLILAEIINRFTTGFTCTAFISKSRDGDPLALVAESYPRGRVLRVPHNTRHVALNTMIDILKKQESVILITPDGPRGPRHVAKPGIYLAAKQTDATITSFTWTASRYWELNTWDRMQIPKPFSTIHVTFEKK